MEISRWREMMKQNVIICKDPAKRADSRLPGLEASLRGERGGRCWCADQFSFLLETAFILKIIRFNNPLQYSCLGNPMDRGAWWDTVHGSQKSQIWCGNYTTTTKRNKIQQALKQSSEEPPDVLSIPSLCGHCCALSPPSRPLPRFPAHRLEMAAPHICTQCSPHKHSLQSLRGYFSKWESRREQPWSGFFSWPFLMAIYLDGSKFKSRAKLICEKLFLLPGCPVPLPWGTLSLWSSHVPSRDNLGE